jgi:hypothetical protein
LFPIISYECSYAEYPELKTESDLISNAESNIDDIAKKEVIIDGMTLQNLKNYRVLSPPFDVTLPEKNFYGVRSGPTRAVSDGYWVFLKPLSLGKHEIYTAGSCLAGKINIEVIHHLIVSDSAEL